MTRARLILSSLRYHARSHVGTLLGAIVASAVLTGSLVVGDSVRKTLQNQAKQRLGHIQAALQQHDRFFRSELAKELELGESTSTAALLRLNAAGYVKNDESETTHRANSIQLIGIDDAFWKFALLKTEKRPALSGGKALINPRLAQQLDLKDGDGFHLRIAKPSVLPRDAPLSVAEDLTMRLSLTVAKVTSKQS